MRKRKKTKKEYRECGSVEEKSGNEKQYVRISSWSTLVIEFAETHKNQTV